LSKNILILSGSPRKGGTTDKLVTAFQEGAEASGKSVTLYRTADLTIAGCLGCRCCTNDGGKCVQTDDMTAVLDAFRKADAVVFASPIYYFTVSAQLKLAIDRTYAVPSDKTQIKKSALLLTCGDTSGGAAEGAVVMYKRMLVYRGWEDAGIVLVPGIYRGNVDIDGREELKQAWKLGQDI